MIGDVKISCTFICGLVNFLCSSINMLILKLLHTQHFAAHFPSVVASIMYAGVISPMMSPCQY